MIGRQSSNTAVRDHFLGGDNMNSVFNCFKGSNEEKYLANRRKILYCKMGAWGGGGREGGGETPFDGEGLLKMPWDLYDGSMETVEYIWQKFGA